MVVFNEFNEGIFNVVIEIDCEVRVLRLTYWFVFLEIKKNKKKIIKHKTIR